MLKKALRLNRDLLLGIGLRHGRYRSSVGEEENQLQALRECLLSRRVRGSRSSRYVRSCLRTRL